MATNPLRVLPELGQSIWLDFIRRDLLTSGGLTRLIEQDALRGMTTNPTIFEQAIGKSDLYDGDIRAARAGGASAEGIFEAIAVRDVQTAADQLRGVWDQTGGTDGFVSIEVSPTLARDEAGTLAAARRLWAACDRPNVMIKIPGTVEGLGAIRRALELGINVNVTLLFAVSRYQAVMKAWQEGLTARRAAGGDLRRVASVASFFVSRVDTIIDAALDARLAVATGPLAEGIRALKHKTAVHNARLAYQAFEAHRTSAAVRALVADGAQLQRPLWASTSTKNPALSDCLYVDELIAPHSVNTLPPQTVDAFRDHGSPQVRIFDDLPQAETHMRALAELGIDFDAAMTALEVEGVQKFAQSFDSLRAVIEKKSAAVG